MHNEVTLDNLCFTQHLFCTLLQYSLTILWLYFNMVFPSKIFINKNPKTLSHIHPVNDVVINLYDNIIIDFFTKYHENVFFQH